MHKYTDMYTYVSKSKTECKYGHDKTACMYRKLPYQDAETIHLHIHSKSSMHHREST